MYFICEYHMKKLLTFIFILIIAAATVVFYGDRVGIDVSKYGIDKSKFAIDLSNIQLCKDNCPEWLKENRIYHDNWSLKQKWCAYENGNFEWLVDIYDENWSLKAEWMMSNNIGYWTWKYFHSNGSLEREWEIDKGKEIWIWTYYYSNWKWK